MSRPVSSNIIYPFIPGTSRDNYVAGIKDIVLVVSAPYTSTETVSGRSEAFVSLQAVNASGALPVDYVFGAFVPTGNTEEFYYREVTFTVTGSEGFGSVQGSDGYSHMFVSYPELVIPGAPTSLGFDNYIVEPGCVRWLHAAVTSLVVVNEQRLSEPADRIGLLNTVLRTFTSGDPIRINNGYNVAVNQNGNNFEIQAYPGAGKGVAPDNNWEDISPPASVTPIKMINGQKPDTEGNIVLDRSNSIVLDVNGSTITIVHNHPGT